MARPVVERQMTFRCSEAMAQSLEQMAKANDRTVSSEVRRAVRLYLLAQNGRRS